MSSSSSSDDEEIYGDLSLVKLLQIERNINIDGEDEEINEIQTVAGELPSDLPHHHPSLLSQYHKHSQRQHQTKEHVLQDYSIDHLLIRSLDQTSAANTSDVASQTESEADAKNQITLEQRRRREQQAMEFEEMLHAGFKYRETVISQVEMELFDIPSLSPYRVRVPTLLRCCWTSPSDESDDDDNIFDSDDYTDLEDDSDPSDDEVEIGVAKTQVIQKVY